MNRVLLKLVLFATVFAFAWGTPLEEAQKTCGGLEDEEFTFWDGFTRIPFKVNTEKGNKEYLGNAGKDKLWWQYIKGDTILDSSRFSNLKQLKKATIQRVPIDDYLPKIFKASIALTEVEGGLRFLGCATDKKDVFLVYETISSNVQKNDFLEYYNGIDFRKRLGIFANLVKQLAALEKVGLIHETLKPSDILYGKYDQGFRISDFDHLVEKGQPLKGKPRPGASPGHYSNPVAKASFVDALYPFVLIIMDEILADWSTYVINVELNPKMKPCWEKLTPECRDKIKTTVMEELEKGPLANPILKTGESYRDTNVGGLISAVLAYENFPFTSDQVVEIMSMNAASFDEIKPILGVDEPQYTLQTNVDTKNEGAKGVKQNMVL